MKKKQTALIQISVLVVLGAAVILTLALPQLAAGDRVNEPLALSVVIREPDSVLWSNARLGMEQAAGELGGELRFLTLAVANDDQEQQQLLEREAEGGADALIVVPANINSLSDQFRQLVGQRPVVCVESQMEGAALTVSPDNQALGRALAQGALEDWRGGVILLLDTAGDSQGVSDRMAAAQILLEDSGVPVQRRVCRSGALVNVLTGLTQETQAVAVIAFEPSATEWAAEAKETHQLQQPLYGVGVSAKVAAALERGTVLAVAAWSDYAAGYLAVEGAIRTARGESYTVEPLPFSLVRGEDIYDPDNQKLLFPVTS